MGLLVNATYVNRTRNAIVGESGVYETWCKTPGQLFRAIQAEHGRCKAKMHLDKVNGEVIHIGWVFEKRMQYSDSPESYLAETWIEVHSQKPEKTIKYFVQNLEEV